MKNILRIISTLYLLSFIHTKGSAQTCIPNNDTISGITPDTLAVAFTNQPYDQVIYFRLPADTNVYYVIGPDTVLLHVCIDSLTIDSVHGLPDGFSFACNLPWCSVHGGSNGCASITGFPIEPQIGIYPLQVFVSVYTNDCYSFALPVQVDTVLFYFIDIEQGEVGIASLNNGADFSIGTIFPNPVNGIVNIPVATSQGGKLKISVMDFEGRNLFSKTVESQQGNQVETLNVSKLDEGSYLIAVAADGRTLFSKIQIVKN